MIFHMEFLVGKQYMVRAVARRTKIIENTIIRRVITINGMPIEREGVHRILSGGQIL